MADFEQISTSDADLKRVQQNVAKKFREQDAPVQVQVQDVVFSAGLSAYTVKPEDVYIVVNARGGPGKIVLPTPNRETRAVKILNAYPSNKVTVVQADAKAIGAGLAEISIPGEGAAEFVCNGRNWFRFDYGA